MSNATKHLGLPDAPSKRRTPAEKHTDEESLADKQAMKAAKAKAAVEQMSRLEQKMETAQAAAIASVKPVCPCPCPKVVKGRGATNAEGSQPNASQTSEGMEKVPTQGPIILRLPPSVNVNRQTEDDGQLERSNSADGVADGKKSAKTSSQPNALQPSEGTEKVAPRCCIVLRLPPSAKVNQQTEDDSQAKHSHSVEGVADGKKLAKMKMVLREAIGVAWTQQKVCQTTLAHSLTMLLLTEATLFFLNLKSSSSTKSSLAGKVKNWAALVEKATVKKPLHGDPKPLQPASMALSMTKLKTLTVSDIAGPPPTENISFIGQNTMVNDDSVLEDLYTMLQNTIFIQVTANLSEPEEDPESQVLPWANNLLIETEAGPEDEVLPWANNDHSLKRKQADSELQGGPETLSDAEDCDKEAAMRDNESAYDGINMEMDLGEKSNIGQSAVHLTTQMVITATNNQLRLFKKVKSEPTSIHSSEQSTNVLIVPNDSGTVSSLTHTVTVESDWYRKDPYQDGWKNKILPTICLWAGTQTNIWSTPKDMVAGLLRLIIPEVFPTLQFFALMLSSAEKCVGVAYQHLCNWRHSVGLAGLTLCTSFFMYSELEQKMAEEIAEFLEHNSFIYEDLASNDLQKAFHSKFIIHLLATMYFPNIKGHVHVEGLATHALVFCDIKGVLGLCGAAIKHGLQLIHTVGLEGLMKGKLTPRPPALFDKQAGKVTTCENSFSDQSWGNATQGLTHAAERRSDAQLNVIVRTVQHAVRELMPEVGGERVDEESDDEYACISFMPTLLISELLKQKKLFMGNILWTIFEYVVHCFLFHINDLLPDHPIFLTLHFFVHGAIYMAYTIAVVNGMACSQRSVRTMPFFRPGLHVHIPCRLHHARLPAYFTEMKYHLTRHYKNSELRFGVTSMPYRYGTQILSDNARDTGKMWDYVFNTVLRA
ncbi:hypothetical protein V8E55_006989 [Tylopilus felleus]